MIRPEFTVYWEAYQDLQSERRTPRGMIPVNAILDYAGCYGLDGDRLKRIIWAVDKTLLAYWKSLDEVKAAEAKAKQHRKSLGGVT